MDTHEIIERLRQHADELERRITIRDAIKDIDLEAAVRALGELQGYVSITLSLDRHQGTPWRSHWSVWDGNASHEGANLKECVDSAVLKTRMAATPEKELNCFEITRQIVPAEAIPF